MEAEKYLFCGNHYKDVIEKDLLKYVVRIKILKTIIFVSKEFSDDQDIEWNS